MIGKNKIRDISNAIIPLQASLFQQEPETTLYEKKVKLILVRYYYYLLNKSDFNEILLLLQEEFFISSKRIADIIAENADEVKKIRTQAPKKEWFKTIASHIIW